MAEKIQFFLMFYPVFLFSLSFHEAAHAWMANRKGDSTARLLGRLTLNPLPHMDFLGTFLFPAFLLLGPSLAVPIGGWGKPVPVNPRNFKEPLRDNMWTAAAGPLSNLFLATCFSGVLHLLFWLAPNFSSSTLVTARDMLVMGVYLNLGLALFNLLPVHPLDGGSVIEGLLPRRYLAAYNRLARYGILLIFIAYYAGLLQLIRIPMMWAAKILLP